MLCYGEAWMTLDSIHDRRRPRIEPYLKRLYGYAYGLAGNADEAKDLVQECAIKALSAKRTPDDENAYRAWLFRILRNAFVDGLRKRAREPRPLEEEFIDQQAEFWGGDERLIDVITVKFALASLSRQHLRVISMIDIAGLSYAETAEELDIPVGTVMSRISRARLALMRLIDEKNVIPLATRHAEAGK